MAHVFSMIDGYPQHHDDTSQPDRLETKGLPDRKPERNRPHAAGAYEAEATGPGRYSPPKAIATEKVPVFGEPVEELVSKSYV